MLKLSECREAMELSADRQAVEQSITSVMAAQEVRLRTARDTGVSFAATEVEYFVGHKISRSTLDGIRTLLLASLRERLGEIDRRISQLVEND